MKRLDVISIPVSIGSHEQFVQQIVELAAAKQSAYTCIANAHMLVEAYKDPVFANDVRNANFVTPGSKSLTWALRLSNGVRQDRVSGIDLLPDIVKEAVKKQLGVYFYGATGDVLMETKEYLMKGYPDLKIMGMYNPPFDELEQAEEQRIIEDINKSGAVLLFVILSCPKQEKWMAGMKNKINACMIGIGGALPTAVGAYKRAPVWLQNAGLEWVFRLLRKPERLFKRYIVTNTVFAFLFFKKYFSKKRFGAAQPYH